MAEIEWVNLPPNSPEPKVIFFLSADTSNSGKILGTNIAPPETPEEIEVWIKERKARFPTAKKVAADAEKERAENEARDKAWVTSPNYDPATSEQ